MPKLIGRTGTMFDRLKATGYLGGPQHIYQNMRKDSPDSPESEEPEPAAQEDSEPGPDEEAPNYRPSENPDEQCGACVHFEEQNQECRRYNFPVQEDYVCDAFKPQGEPPMQDDSEADRAGEEMMS